MICENNAINTVLQLIFFLLLLKKYATISIVTSPRIPLEKLSNVKPVLGILCSINDKKFNINYFLEFISSLNLAANS